MGKAEYWAEHLAAIEAEGVRTRAYAPRQGLSAASLYTWRWRLKGGGAGLAPLPARGGFMAVQLRPSSEPLRCTLTIGGGATLALSQMPSPQWVAALCAALAWTVR